MKLQNPISLTRAPGLAKDLENPKYVLEKLRASIAVLVYLNYKGTPNVNQRLTNIINDISVRWQYGQDSWDAEYPNSPVQIAEYWREWAPDYFTTVTAHTKEFVQYVTK